MYVTIPSSDSRCLGDGMLRSLLMNYIGYDTVVLNWLLNLHHGNGFIYNVQSRELTDLNFAKVYLDTSRSDEKGGNSWESDETQLDESPNSNSHAKAQQPSAYLIPRKLKQMVFKIAILVTTLFLFFTTTTLVSFTLRETQDRMLNFTFLLQHHIRNRMDISSLVFIHVVESLIFVPIMVGILFFLFEFFGDQVLAMYVLGVVWMCEVFSVISMRSLVCMQFFPRVFFLYFTLFHVYF